MTSIEHSDSDRSPVLVLGAHRSGTSVVTGLLALAGGLELGDVMPSTEANARGYFESVAIVRAHNQLLDSLDRDWTCPPPTVDPVSVPTTGIAAEIDRLQSSGRTWGVKDPRLLYMLPVWVQLVPSVRFVGVVREHEEVVRSLCSRDGIDPRVAESIASAHVHRLLSLREQFEFPIIDVSSGSDSVVEQTRRAANTLGLSWDSDAATEFYDASMFRNRSQGRIDSADVDTLRKLAKEPTGSVPITSDEFASVLEDFAAEIDDFDRYSGPRANVRRARVWRAVPRSTRNAFELTRNLKVAASFDPVPSDGQVAECRDLPTLFERLRAANPRPDSILLPDITSWVSSKDELATVFELLMEYLALDGTVVIGVSPADAATQQGIGRTAWTADDVRTAAATARFIEFSPVEHDGSQTLRFAARSTETSLLRAVLERRTTSVDQRLGDGWKPTGSAPDPVPSVQSGDWETLYKRLRNRRSVRATLRVADSAAPAVRAFRSAKRRLRRG